MPSNERPAGASPTKYMSAGIDDHGETFANPLRIATPSAPQFAGAASAEGGGAPGSVTVYWDAATDASTPQNKIVYEVFAQSGSAPTSFEYPYVTGPGATSFSTDNYGWDDPVYFIVRARNRAGVRDENTIAVSAQPAADTNPPYFDGLVLGARMSETTGAVAWAPANDDDPYNSWIDIRIDVWLATSPGGQNYANPPNKTAYNNEGAMLLTGLDPAVTYYAVGRARDAYDNRETNTVQKVIPALSSGPIPDIDPPVLTVVSPAPGAVIATGDRITFDVTDETNAFALIAVSVQNGAHREVVHDGQDFVRPYANASTRTAIPTGWRYVVGRVGGWRTSPTFFVNVVDKGGNAG